MSAPWQNSWYQPPVESSPDLKRILALPRREQLEPGSAVAEELVDLMTERYQRLTTSCLCASMGRECITRLKVVQAHALAEIELKAGLLGPIQVGDGKTIIGLVAPLALPDCRLALLLVPSSVLSQLVFDYKLLSQHFRVPSLVTHGGSTVRIEQPEKPWLHVFPYSRLSRQENTDFIEKLKPDVIIADECDKLRHPATATTSRVLRYFQAHPETRFCAWSGSITGSSIKDYAHLAGMALGEDSPLPIDPRVVDDWARAIDPSDYAAPAGALEAFCNPGETVQSAFNRRLVETEGVVTSTAPSVEVALRIKARPAPPIPYEIEEHLQTLRSHWVRPDGEEFVDALRVAACACELACGFFYRWIFPRGESRDLIERWFEARKLWKRSVRVKLRERRAHLDSEDLCKQAAMRAWGDIPNEEKKPEWKSIFWPAWRDISGLVQPEKEAVWIDDYLAEAAAEWAAERVGIVWYGHQAFGRRVAELGKLPLHSGGVDAGEKIGKERGERSIVASIKSHGRGRNGLQFFFNEQLVACPPSSATDWEQLLGRTHRKGQTRAVSAEFFVHTPELAAHLDTALSRARYVQATLGAKQKLLLTA